jgi:hypothetical protein
VSPRERRTGDRRGSGTDPRAGLSDRQRRLNERRTRVRRARRGMTARLILSLQVGGVALVALFAAWGAYSRVIAAERLKVAHVEVRGGHFLSDAEVRDLLGPAMGENILALDIARLTARLRSSPWVAEATVARSLPDTLRVQVRERAPLALAEVERLYLMDGEGVLIDVYGPRTAGFDLPIVRGLGRADEDERRQRAQRAGELLRDLGPLAGELSELEVDERGEVRVVLRGAGERLLLGGPPYRAKLVDYLGLREELLKRCPQAEWFDLRFQDRIVARNGGAWPEKENGKEEASGPPAPARVAAPDAVPAAPAVTSPPSAAPAVQVPLSPSGTDAGSGESLQEAGRAAAAPEE